MCVENRTRTVKRISFQKRPPQNAIAPRGFHVAHVHRESVDVVGAPDLASRHHLIDRGLQRRTCRPARPTPGGTREAARDDEVIANSPRKAVLIDASSVTGSRQFGHSRARGGGGHGAQHPSTVHD